MKEKANDGWFHFVNAHCAEVYINIGQIASIDDKEVTMSNGTVYGLTREQADELMTTIGVEGVSSGYERWWGGEAEYDLAQDLEGYYEQTYGKSAVYWEQEGVAHAIPTDSLDNRPETYVTSGYTSDYEGWGQSVVAEAVRSGCDSATAVYDYIVKRG